MAGQRKAPTRKAPATTTGIRLSPASPQGFDPFAASKRELIKYGLPLRPDPHKEPGAAGLWERQAARYRSFEHLEPKPDTSTANKKGLPANTPTELRPRSGSGPTRSSHAATSFSALRLRRSPPCLLPRPRPTCNSDRGS